MPSWFAEYAVERQAGAPGSMLELYRTALRLRRDLQTGESLTWHDGADGVVWFSRPNGWHHVSNLAAEPVALPAGQMILASGPVGHGELPGDTSVWLRVDDER